MSKIDLNNIKYLSLEGGGGKGMVYLGAVRGLEKKYNTKSIIDVNKPLDERKIIGISGASAGAITAFMLATGMSALDIAFELKRYGITEIGREITRTGRHSSIQKPKRMKVGIFETFFDTMSRKILHKYRVVEKNKRERNYIIEKPFWLNFADVILKSFISDKKLRESFLLNKIFNTPVEETATNSSTHADIYLHSLFAYRGIFSGISVRDYFKKLLEKRISERLKNIKIKLN